MTRDPVCGMSVDKASALKAERASAFPALTALRRFIGGMRSFTPAAPMPPMGGLCVRKSRAIAVLAAALVAITPEAWGSALTPVFEAALEQNPGVQAIIARRGEIAARRQAADNLLPAPPSIALGATSDLPARDLGANEFELELAAPVWLPGEREATRNTVETSAAELEADLAATRLEVARTVREAFWDVVERRELLALSIQKRDVARALAEDTQRRVKAGLAAQADAHLAEADRQEAEGAFIERTTDLDQAIIAFRNLTGLAPPEMTAEPEPASRPDHPSLTLLRRILSAADAEIRLTAVVDREPPEIGVLARVERGDREEQYNTLVGIRVRIPFAGEQRNAPRRAAAEAARSAAVAELWATERDIEAEIAKARAALSGAQRQAGTASARFASQEAAFGFSERAYRAGEIGLTELIRLRAQMFDAANDRAIARIAVERARSNLIQAYGIEP